MLLRIMLGVSLGAVLGGALGSTRSCETGTCPLTSSPWRGAFFGGVLGMVAVLASVSSGYPTPDAATDSGRATEMQAEATVVKSKAIEELTSDNFEDVIGDGVVLVDFWAPWCGPCRRQAPILEQVANSIGDSATIGKLDVDDHSEVAKKHRVSSIPTLILFVDGQPAERFVGVQTKDRLLAALRDAGKD